MNRNTDVKQEIIQAQRLQLALGDQVSEPIAVIETNPKLVNNLEVISFTASTTGLQTILAAASNNMPEKSLAIYAIEAGYNKTAACDIANGQITITCTRGGKTVYLCSFDVITLTAEKDHISISFPKGIVIDKNTTVSMSGTFAAGAMVRHANIFYSFI